MVESNYRIGIINHLDLKEATSECPLIKCYSYRKHIEGNVSGLDELALFKLIMELCVAMAESPLPLVPID